MRTFTKLILLLSFIVLCDTSIFAQKKVYFIESLFGKIQRINPDGSELEDLVIARLNSPTDIQANPTTNMIYWAETNKVLRMDASSGQVEIIVEYAQEGAFGTTIPGIALDMMHNKLYWIHGAEAKIQRSNLDGSNAEDVITSDVINPLSLAVDPENEKVYWSGIGGYIKRANFDGTEIEDVVTSGIFQPEGMTLDLVNNKIYWADLVGNDINRANLDGTEVEEVITEDLENPVDVVLSEDKTEIYWLDKGRTGDEGTLQQANIDGSEVTEFVTGMEDPLAITINISSDELFWLDEGSFQEPPYIGRINADGSNQEIALSALSGFENLKFNESLDKLYWIDQSSNDIFRANLDGSETERVLETVTLNDFAFDSENQHIYWGENDAIRRANPDGSDIQDLITDNLDEPASLVLDITANKMYWVDGGFSADRIKWANLDGSGNTDFITGLDQPSDLQLENMNGKIYWLEGGTFATDLRRANKDGTNIQDVASEGSGINSYKVLGMNGRLLWSSRDIFASNLDGSDGITLIDHDDAGLSGFALGSLTIDDDEKLYWNDNDTDEHTIWRANLDGTEIEPVITGLPTTNDREIIVVGESPSAVRYEPAVVKDYHLSAAYPNPFNASTTIQFSLPDKSHINLTIYNLAGQAVKTLLDESREAGTYSVKFTTDALPTGVYFARFKAEHYTDTRKLTLLK